MLNELRLKCYRQHVDRTFNFSQGLNVMRGANERGKSSVLEALLYLWLGSRALNEPLSDVVTYGYAEKDLRVEGSFTIDGVNYEAYRCKAGAEILYSDKRVTGQTDTRRFMEALLGAKADVVRQLMVAEQNSVRGILLSDGDAGALIEELAELGLIDTYIEKIQTQLPCGPTKGQEATVQTLTENIPQVPEAPSAEAVYQAEQAFNRAVEQVEAAEPELAQRRVQASAAATVLNKAAAAQAKRDAMQKRINELKAVEPPIPCQWSAEDIANAEKLESDASLAVKVEAERSKQFQMLENTWTGTEEEAEKAIEGLRAEIKSLNSEASSLRTSIATKKATSVNEGVCAFCKEDISQRPEAVKINADVAKFVAEAEHKLATLNSSIIAAESDIGTIEQILKVHRGNTAKATAGYWEPVVGKLPCEYVWVGPKKVDCQSVSVGSKVMRKALADYNMSQDRYESAQLELATAEVPAGYDEDSVAEAKECIKGYEEYVNYFRKLQADAEACKNTWNIEQVRHESALTAYEDAKARLEQAVVAADKATETLAAMVFNNELIKDLREARSEIRRRMWKSVTSAISIYFSRIRGIPTVIEQSPDGFTQNGKSVKGLSGSAKDMLGLSLRAALLKTFIPGATIMVTDEPFSGCDDNRETAGIGVLATLGFDQTILVTHSDLADAVADRMVEV